ncbi:MAG: hypothetical protein WCJ92_06535 [Alphaproteobacteria bacterium]
MKGIHKLTVALLTVVAVTTWNTTFATSMTIDVEGSDSASHSGAISVGTLNKTNAGALALSGTNAIGALGIHGGKVSVSSASNLNGASSAVTFAASGTDPVTAAANTATLEIAGTMNTGAFAFSTAGTVQVDSTYTATLNAVPTGTGLVHKTGSGVMKVASDLGPQTVTCTFDTADGYYKNGATVIAWPSNFTTFSNDLGGFLPSYSGWNTTDTNDQGVSYGGIRLNYFGGTSYTGSPFYYYTDAAMSAAHPTTVIPTPIAGIHVDAGTLYVQSGKAPNAPIQIASGAALQLAGVDESAESQISSALTVQSGGSIEVDADVSVGSALSVTTTYTFDTADGYYKNGAARIAWPSNLTGFNSGPNDIAWAPSHPWNTSWASWWSTNDTTNHNLTYGGVTLGFLNITGDPLAAITGNYVYYFSDANGLAAHPTTSVSTGMDAALSGTVLMESGSAIVLGAGSNWGRNITVGTAS